MGDDQIVKDKISQMTELEKFDKLFPVLIDDLTKPGLKNPEISQAIAWFKKVLLILLPHWELDWSIFENDQCMFPNTCITYVQVIFIQNFYFLFLQILI